MKKSTTAGRRVAALLATALSVTVAACGHLPANRSAAAVPVVDSPSAATSATPSPKADARAEAARVRAIKAVSALHSYAFASTASVGTHRTSVAGRASLPSSMTYVLSENGTRQEVVRTNGATYLRSIPGNWKRLTSSSKSPSPVKGLLDALRLAGSLSLDPTGRRLAGTINSAQAASAGLVKAGRASDLQVSFALDAYGRVTAFELHTAVASGTTSVPVNERTTYGEFDRSRPVTAPRP